MSEEELINSFDPDNVENNYHIPPHLYKQLQLNHFRQMCCEVLTNALYISSYQVASDAAALKQAGITHIVNTAGDVCENCFPNLFSYCTYYLKDINGEDISLLFYRTIEWIHEAIKTGGRVFVHCHQGVSRSATMVIAYLMWKEHISFEVAHERLRKVRPICNPNTGFTCQLLLLGKRLGIGSANPTTSQFSDKLRVFRVSTRDPRESFLLMLPVPSWSHWIGMDPRFAWVVQHGATMVVWLGAQCDEEASRAIAEQNCRWAEKFERCEYSLSYVQDGFEPLQFWRLLGLQATPKEPFSVTRVEFDLDVESVKAAGKSIVADARAAL